MQPTKNMENDDFEKALEEFEKFRDAGWGEKFSIMIDKAYGALDFITDIIHMVPESFFDYPDKQKLVKLLLIEAFSKIQCVKTLIEKDNKSNIKEN